MRCNKLEKGEAETSFVFRSALIGRRSSKKSLTVRNIFFTHAFVSFSRQYEYAKKFGFLDEKIIFNALSCDTELFDKALSNLENKSADYPHIFIYAGRFSKEKGINELVEAFKIYRDEQGGTWKLLCVGNGNLQHLLLHLKSNYLIIFD